MSNTTDLSKRQQSILDYIWEYIRGSGRPPTIREIGQAVKISSTSVVNYNLTKLTEKGYLARDAEVSRGLRLTDKTEALYGGVTSVVKGLVRIPMVGTIVASEPLEVGHENFATYDEEDAVELSTSMLPDKSSDDLFALRVSGDSMIDAMVNDGDIVIMRKQSTARNGDMVAVWLTPSDTTTLKYFYNEGTRVRLQPANPTMGPIYVEPSQVTVQGKVMMVLRQTA
ncbi:MAG: transcriptional repressor LexA [Chloroflexi bacterium]|nr:transcriptional repressor LexA [Chloroflexota bacterium]MCI0578552.1 transcriptional repressor LexA [Chloroflexota bacterium]MCI0648328.1 transcriptional repressor LexA [Chloroflexota bacterium]MCI0729565.1 transcriptional repressor LexA [Chloroflexota bacterium]